MTRAALYVRVSSDRQAREGDSIPAQLDALHKYALEHNYAVYGEYIDDGISGTRSDRDELQRLLDDIDRFDIILFCKLDRWFRSIRHYINTQEILDAHGVGWKAIWESYDTTTPQGRLIVNQMMSFAQFEAENTGQRIRQVFAYKASKGEVLTGMAPAGYRIQNKRLVPSETAESVRTAFREYSRTGSLNATMRACSGLPGLPRTQAGLKRLLMNPVYLGKRHGHDDYCEPLVTQEVFDDIQRMLGINIRQSQRETYIFSGLIRCAECGSLLGGHTRRNSHGKRVCVHTYSCRKHYQTKPPVCPNTKIITETVFEQELIARLRPLIQGEVLRYEIEAEPIRDHRSQITAIEKKLQRLKDLYLNELISMEEYRRDRADLEEQLQELQEKDKPRERDLSVLKAMLKTDIEELYWDLTPEEKRRFWRAIIKEVRWTKDRQMEVIFLD